MGGRVRRRKFVALVGCAVIARPRWASAQKAGRNYRIGWLGSNAPSFTEPYSSAFVHRLGELGFVEGPRLTIEKRHADNKLEMLPALATELVKLKCDVLFGAGPEANLAALIQSSHDTPIVFVAVDFDPVATGHVASLARPGGRVTGVTTLQSVLPAKRLELCCRV